MPQLPQPPLLLLLLLPSAVLAGGGVASGISCTLSSTSAHVVWPALPHTDLYYVAMFADTNSSRPYAVVTSATTSADIEDLLPNTSYVLRTRAHSAAAPLNLVANWSAYSAPAVCTTAATSHGQPHGLQRVGAAPASTTVELTWQPPAAPACGRRRACAYVVEYATSIHSPEWVPAVAVASTRAVVRDLHPHQSYYIRVRASAAMGTRDAGRTSASAELGVSDPIRFNTAPAASNTASSEFLRVYRVSEYTSGVDFLLNHNAGDLMGEVSFMGDSGNWAAADVLRGAGGRGNTSSNTCVVALWGACGGHASSGSFTACMGCASSAWRDPGRPGHAGVRAECSDPAQPWPLDNKLAAAFCGVSRGNRNGGFFSFADTPVAEYCVELLPSPSPSHSPPSPAALTFASGTVVVGGSAAAAVPTTSHNSAAAAAGHSLTHYSQHDSQHDYDYNFAPYVSCDAPEAGALNTPADPVCICAWCVHCYMKDVGS